MAGPVEQCANAWSGVLIDVLNTPNSECLHLRLRSVCMEQCEDRCRWCANEELRRGSRPASAATMASTSEESTMMISS
jgi:hypothetical protein